MPTKRWFGKYRAIVENNIDPDARARLKVSMPDMPDMLPVWAEACLPPRGFLGGGPALPLVDSTIWVEFEAGDSSKPIWVGVMCADPIEGVQTPTIHSDFEMLAGPDGGLTIRSARFGTLGIGQDGIWISNDKGASIRLVGPTVDVNAGALTVT